MKTAGQEATASLLGLEGLDGGSTCNRFCKIDTAYGRYRNIAVDPGWRWRWRCRLCLAVDEAHAWPCVNSHGCRLSGPTDINADFNVQRAE